MTTSTPKTAGAPVAMSDGLVNVASGLGTNNDKQAYNSWAMAGGIYGVAIPPGEIEAAYRSNWVVRKVHDDPPEEMTKEWREWNAKPDEVEAIEAEERRLGLKSKCQLAELYRLLGGGALILGLPGATNTAAPATVPLKGLRYVHVVTRYALRADNFEENIDSVRFGLPKSFLITAGTTEVEIHPSRVVVFPGRPIPDLRVGVSSQWDRFWGAPLMESINEAMQNTTLTQGGVASLIHEMKQDVFGIPNLTDLVSTAEGEARLTKRFQTAATMKSLFNMLIRDAGEGGEAGVGGETWETRQLNFAGLAEIVNTYLQIASGAADYPLTRLLGTAPKGMNATGEHDEKNFIAMIRGRQQTQLRPALEQLDPFLLGSALGSVPKGITWAWRPLTEISEADAADIDLVVSETIQVIADTGLIPHDALSKVQIAILEATGRFPNIKAEAAKSAEPLPVVAKSQMEAKAAETQNTVSLKSVEAKAGQRMRKAANDSLMLNDAAPRTLYVSRQVLNPQEILRHFRAQGLPNLMAAGDLHVSIICTETPVDWMRLPGDWSQDETGRKRIPAGGARVVEKLGPKYVVQHFESEDLQWRFNSLVRALAEQEAYPVWADLQPHISLTDDPEDFDISTLKPYTGRIVLGPETFVEARTDAPVGIPDIDEVV